MKKLTSISAVFPAYNDENTIATIVKKAQEILPTVARKCEIIVVNDRSTDATRDVLQKLQKESRTLHVVTHRQNKGYGAALTAGFRRARSDFIFYTDGDGQYDVGELTKLVDLMDGNIDMVTGFKRVRSDPWFRKVVGTLYNHFIKLVFGIKIRDVDCDFRLFRRSILQGVTLTVSSGAFDVAFIKKLQEKNVRFKEVGVSHYQRRFGNSQFFTLPNVAKSLRDLVHLVYET